MSTEWKLDIRDVRLQIALSLIAATGPDAATAAKEIAAAVDTVSQAVMAEERAS